MTQYQVNTSGPLVMKLIGLGILHHNFVHFAGKKGVYVYTPLMIKTLYFICKNSK